MALVNDKTLCLQGRVEPGLLPNLLGALSIGSDEDHAWFFVDYSTADFPLKSTFNLFFSPAGKPLNTISVASLEAVYDSFGHLLEEGIPRGYKTVSRFAFPDGLPPALEALPVLKEWHPTGSEILLANTGDIEMNKFPVLLGDLAHFLVSGFQERYPSKLQKIDKNEFIKSLKESGFKDSENLLAFLTLGGYVRQTEDEVELVSNE